MRVSRQRLPWKEMKKWTFAPTDPAWWVAFTFMTGGVFFAVGAFASLPTELRHTGPRPSWYFYLTLVQYLIGGALFTGGSVVLLWESVREQAEMYELHSDYEPSVPTWAGDSSHWHLAAAPGETSARGERRSSQQYGSTAPADGESPPSKTESPHSPASLRIMSLAPRLWRWWWPRRGIPNTGESTATTPLLLSADNSLHRHEQEGALDAAVAEHYMQAARRERVRATWSDPWCRRRYFLDVTGAWVLFVGVQAYNVMIVAEMVEALSSRGWRHRVVLGLVTYPCDIGGLCFAICSWLYFVSSNGTFSPAVFRPHSRSYWIASIGLVGSIGFLCGPIFPAWIQDATRVDGLVPNWLGLLLGYGIGSLLFVVQGYLMILHLSNVDLDTQRAANVRGGRVV